MPTTTGIELSQFDLLLLCEKEELLNNALSYIVFLNFSKSTSDMFENNVGNYSIERLEYVAPWPPEIDFAKFLEM